VMLLYNNVAELRQIFGRQKRLSAQPVNNIA
jgi:hypothetical protein